MNEILKELRVLPLYGQIIVQDAGTEDIPDWVSGEERLVVSQHCLLVATQGDSDGDVQVKILMGASGDDLGDEIYSGSIDVSSGVLEFGSLLAGEFGVIDLEKSGTLNLRIFVQPLNAPSTVSVLLIP